MFISNELCMMHEILLSDLDPTTIEGKIQEVKGFWSLGEKTLQMMSPVFLQRY